MLGSVTSGYAGTTAQVAVTTEQAVETSAQLVFTTEQAAEILDIQRKSIISFISGKNESIGKKVVWHKGEVGNPIPSGTFVLLAYVRDLARSKGRMTAVDKIKPSQLHFPSVPVELQYEPTASTSAENDFRQEELLRVTESAVREAHAEEIRRIEIERDAARRNSDAVQRELHEARDEINDLRSALEESLATTSRLIKRRYPERSASE